MISSQSPVAGGFVCRNERRSRKDNGAGTTINRFVFVRARFPRVFRSSFPSRQTKRQRPRLVSLKVGRQKKKEKLVSEKRTGRYVTLVPSDERFRVLFHWTKSLELL